MDSARVTIARRRGSMRRYGINDIDLVIKGFKGDHIFEQIRASGSLYEEDLLDTISRGLPETPAAAVDVGANIGNHSLFFASVFKCPVLAIEPSPATANVLRENIRENGLDQRIQVVQEGASDSRRSIFLHSPNARNLGMARLEELALSDEDSRVLVRPLDEIIANWREVNRITHVDLIKIDVEGHEERVLAGAASTLRTSEPTLLIEAAQEGKFLRIKSMLAPMGYRAFGPYCATPTYVFAKQWRTPTLLYRLGALIRKRILSSRMQVR